MDKKRVFVRLLLIGAGGGCLALAIFVGLPRLTALLAPTQPMEPMESEAIIARGFGTRQPLWDDDRRAEGEQMPVSSPHMAPQDEEALYR